MLILVVDVEDVFHVDVGVGFELDGRFGVQSNVAFEVGFDFRVDYDFDGV